MKDSTKQYDGFARLFEEADLTFPDSTRPEIYELMEKEQLSGKRLLDLGCGYGKDLAYFANLGSEVYGIDASNEMLKLARKRVPQSKLKLGKFENLPYPNNHFDYIFSRYAIQHSANTEAVFRESARVLKSLGELVFLVTHPIRNYLEKDTKNYWQAENILSPILNGQLTVTEPSHTLTEYLSPFLLSNFNLLDFREKGDPAAKKFDGFGEYPRILILKYQKK